MTETRKVRDVSGSVVVTLPKALRDEAGLDEGDTAALTIEDGRVVIQKVDLPG